MFKLFGSAIILIASALFGVSKYNEYYERKRLLCSIRDGASRIETALRCTCPPLYECFLCGGEFFEKAAFLVNNGSLPEEAVKDAARSFHILKKSDLSLIERYAAGLSALDLKGQLSNTTYFCQSLEKNISEAENELNTRGKLFLKGCMLTAAAVVILLI